MFPPIESALDDPNGLLAMGGDLDSTRLVEAYSHGIFPWYEEGQPLLWWSPDPRAVIFTDKVQISKSLRKTMRKAGYKLSMNTSFSDVIRLCAAPRASSPGTWITDEMETAYNRLHTEGYAHSFEVWSDSELVGGLYGVAVKGIFSGESMFHLRTDASKVAFVALCVQLSRWGLPVVDCQINNPHLESLGAEEIPRLQYKEILQARPTGQFRNHLDWRTALELEESLQ